jgi:phospholipid/cholesterol/gamma-HCH transport system permease protein
MADSRFKLKQTLTYNVFKSFYKEAVDWFETVGEIGNNFFCAMKYIVKLNVNLKNTFEQMNRIGIEALPLTLGLVGITGMIIALQISHEMVNQGAGSFVGMLVSLAIVRELGPIMGCFAVISMIGSSMAAEIGTMKVTEQIDAMKILGVDPIQNLLVPRIIAGFFIMPFAILLANIVGIAGGLISSNIISDLSVADYMDSVWKGLTVKDILVSLLKASIFGGIISLVSSSIGYKTEGGSLEVGMATTKAVVWSFIAMVVADYFLSLIFFN